MRVVGVGMLVARIRLPHIFHPKVCVAYHENLISLMSQTHSKENRLSQKILVLSDRKEVILERVWSLGVRDVCGSHSSPLPVSIPRSLSSPLPVSIPVCPFAFVSRSLTCPTKLWNVGLFFMRRFQFISSVINQRRQREGGRGVWGSFSYY